MYTGGSFLEPRVSHVRWRRARQFLGLATGVALLASAAGAQSGPIIIVQEGFTVEKFVDMDLPLALAITPDPEGEFGNYLYVATGEFDFGQIAPSDPVLRVDLATRTTELFFTLPGESDVTSMAFGPGGPFTTGLYFCSNNRDGGLPGDFGGAIVFLDSDPSIAGEQFLVPSGILSEPSSIQFGPGGAFGTDLFLANTSAPPFAIRTISPGGAVADFATYGTAVPSNIAFGPGGNFGSDLFVSNPFAGIVETIDASGNVSLFATIPGFTSSDWLGGMVFSTGGPFGENLYLTIRIGVGGRHALLRIAPDGTVTEFSSGYRGLPGFGTIPSFGGLEFSRDGNSLFVADHQSNAIFRIEPCPEHCLDARPDWIVAGDALTLATSSAPPDQFAMLVLVDVNQTPLFFTIGRNILDSQGSWDWTQTIPGGFPGLDLTFQSLALVPGGGLSLSNRVLVNLR